MAELDNGSTAGVSSKLYLFTFLATLFFLLIVSTVIVVRSLIIRRRLEIQINEAIRGGLVAAPRNPGSRHRKFMKRPKLHDAWVAQEGGESDEPPETWEEMMPLSVQRLLRVHRHVKRRPPPANANESTEHNLLSLFMDRTPDLPRDELTDKPHKSCECKLLDEKGNKADEFLLQVSVFVAMPSPPQNHLPKDSSAEQEGQVPDLSLGVVRIALPRTKEDPEDEADEVNGEIVV